MRRFSRDDKCDIRCYFWVPEKGARQWGRRDGVPYLQWIRQGHVEAAPGEAIDYEIIRPRVVRFRDVVAQSVGPTPSRL